MGVQELDDFDFGFTAVSEEELKAVEAQLQTKAAQQGVALAAATDAAVGAQQKLQQLYKMIMPLLHNLAKDADSKDYIYWPGRQEKIQAFIKKVETLVNDN